MTEKPREASPNSVTSSSETRAMVSSHKIAVATDFSDSSRRALRVASALMMGQDSELVLVHVLKRSRSSSDQPMFRRVLSDDLTVGVEQELADWANIAKQSGARRVSSAMLMGTPRKELVELLENDSAFDLIVVGTHGKTGVTAALLGSVAERVVRHAPCSVLVVRDLSDDQQSASPTGYARILAAIDFSDLAREAMRRAAVLAAEMRAELVLLHVHDLPVPGPDAAAAMPADLAADLATQVECTLASWAVDAERLGASRVTTEIVTSTDTAWSEIVELLRADPRFDLVVVGTHGRTGIARVLLGSVAESVVARAPCSVLVVRQRARPTPNIHNAEGNEP